MCTFLNEVGEFNSLNKYACLRERECVCVCLCVLVGERESECVSEWVSVCVCERESVCVCMCVSERVSVGDKETTRGASVL